MDPLVRSHASAAFAWSTRAEHASDIDAIRAITIAAFDGTTEADLIDALRAGSAWIEGLSIVATTSDGTVVGHALLTRCHVDAVPALCLAPCSVSPAYQRQGAGSAAIRAALEAAMWMGEAFVIVLGHPTFYPRFGFRRASEADIRVSLEVPDDVLMALTLDAARPLPSGLVRYPPAFGI
jgi:predicted N-acetyltransferase YhbS